MSKENPPLPPTLLTRARELRQQQTDTEKLLWALLRNRGLGGFKFRRQHPIEPYVVDFYCDEKQLAVELDGIQHAMSEKQEYDQRRAESLRRRGIHIVRVGNERVLEDTQRVLLEIWQALLAGPRPSPPAPLPEGEGSQTQ